MTVRVILVSAVVISWIPLMLCGLLRRREGKEGEGA